MSKIKLRVRIEKDGPEMTIAGRYAWCFKRLKECGERGCTPIERPAPRWSHYVWVLRGLGLEIETITEPHDGPYAGTHARYVLRSDVEIVEDCEVPA
ncbi:winged helix domain-containing protein [Phyllobacterium meliloti]|uniref:winged helix domain-containing protein n=1 Tax=Phyllobacterium meliloti TaxID=555317 RepID=UPI00351D4D10